MSPSFDGGWPRLLTKRKAAAYCGVSVNTFARLVREGVYPRPKEGLGRQHMWDRVEIDGRIDGTVVRAVGAEQKALEAIHAFARQVR